EERQDPYGRNYYWLTGNFVNFEPESTDTDEAALSANYIAVVPVKADMTAHEHLATIKQFEHV
ncbi:MAG: 5'/3'-nucleotidase SurE, partial [Bacteroidia bacterium]